MTTRYDPLGYERAKEARIKQIEELRNHKPTKSPTGNGLRRLRKLADLEALNRDFNKTHVPYHSTYIPPTTSVTSLQE